MSIPIVTQFDDDVYVECSERKYVNQDILVENESTYCVDLTKEEQCSGDSDKDGIDSTYYNIVELPETSRYLQLRNPNDEEESIYVNADEQENNREDTKEKLFGTKTMNHHSSTFEGNNFGNETFILGNSGLDKTPGHLDSETFSGENDCGIAKPPPLPPKKRC